MSADELVVVGERGAARLRGAPTGRVQGRAVDALPRAVRGRALAATKGPRRAIAMGEV